MYITLEADYAVRILLYLYEQGKRCDAKTISEDTEVTLRFALKILRKLAAAGLVQSFKGFKGGYEVACPANQTTLYDVIQTIEGNCHISRCLDNEVGCNAGREATCRMRREFARITKILEQELKQVTFQKMLEGECPCAAAANA
ncbi:MAG TPA: Rrf2 family transcriptional regulator [Candidatus Egerieicola pullicola]|uniref:Rrf2 family transcriptional regulator n=1 Tax=Candidatus Egerieicola pullicola TaxID=2840775 RepID=A0A9D1AIQ3_9FIRM|nr:Rrf2 family transcriptional regulator [Candidatus Egerieicola pullicola]